MAPSTIADERPGAGHLTLEAFEQAPRFNAWMYDSIRPWLGKRLAELGAGRGNLSLHLRQGREVLLTDQRDDHVALLQARWGREPGVTVARLDMTRAEDHAAIRHFRPDTVVFLNVLEHIADDRLVLHLLHESVPSGGRLVVLVPYGMAYFSAFDREIGHHRRYGKGELEGKAQEAGFVVEHQHYFNKPGKLAWFLANTLGRRKRISPWQLRIYNTLTPLFRIWDQVVPGTGLSTVVVCRRP